MMKVNHSRAQFLPWTFIRASLHNDYGVIFKVEAAGKGFDELIHYHIYWAIDQTDTIEDDTWVHENMQLIARA